MQEIRLYTNKRYFKLSIGICVLLLLLAFYLSWRDGIAPESVVVGCVSTFGIVYALFQLRDNQPMLIVRTDGLEARNWKGRVITWNEIRDIDFYTPGRFAEFIRVKMHSGQKLIAYKHYTLHKNDLIEILRTMLHLSPEERSGFINHVNRLHGVIE